MLRAIHGARLIARKMYPISPAHISYARNRLYATQDKRVNDDVQDGQKVPSQADFVDQPPNEANASPDPQPILSQLEEKDAQLAEMNDKTLRVLAEMENVRMIARRDVENAKKYGAMPFAHALLSVADNLGLALKSVPEDALNSPDEQHLKGLHAGIGATESELLKAFSQHGIQRFGAVGDTFDPNKYQAVFEAPSPDHEPGTVMDVTKLGYTFGDRILRPAEVGVSKAP